MTINNDEIYLQDTKYDSIQLYNYTININQVKHIIL